MERRLRRRSTSVLVPLTPSLDRVLPPAPAVVPDLRVEEALYRALQFERQRNAALTKEYFDLQEKFKRFRINRHTYGLGRAMKASHNPAPSGKRVQ